MCYSGAMLSDSIYRLFVPSDWAILTQSGVFYGHAEDLRDGFIHFSTAHTLIGTALHHYAGHPYLILAQIPCTDVQAELKWELARDGDLFPHLYAPLYYSAVSHFWLLSARADGEYNFPSWLVSS